jgi:hypothetical protein
MNGDLPFIMNISTTYRTRKIGVFSQRSADIYWAVDWDYRDDTFHNQWQTYRSRKSPKIVLKTPHQYDEPGNYIIVIKVIDILGNDTTKAVTVVAK